MRDHFRVAIIGSGPAGLSAACHAARNNTSHILLEAAPQIANTTFRYQKGKHVMAEPSILPLRSDLPFEAGRRESVLRHWALAAGETPLNVHFDAEVAAISRDADRFTIRLKNHAQVTADKVVLAIGMQGNLRWLGIPGQDNGCVQYQLDDPEEYRDETIVIVGAGDAAIENALALAPHNQVSIVNRRNEFTRAKDANNAAILAAIDEGRIRCFYDSAPKRIEDGRRAGRLILDTADGEASIDCDRVIARLGAIPPRRFVESCGVSFPSDDPAAVPAVSATYESEVPGLYIIGALGGYPLIKQALNQGYEVIEYILERTIKPADAPLLEKRLAPLLTDGRELDAVIEQIRRTVPLFEALTALQLRELLLDSEVHALPAGQDVFRKNDYTNSFYSIVQGQVEVEIKPERRVGLTAGQFFGEMGLISGRRRSATVRTAQACILIETPRRRMNKLVQSVQAVAEVLDRVFVTRALRNQLVPDASEESISLLAEASQTRHYKARETIYREGEPSDSIHLIRRGSVTGARTLGGREVVLAYLPAGQYFGDVGVLGDRPREETVTAAVASEVIRIDAAAFRQVMQQDEAVRLRVNAVYRQRLLDSARQGSDSQAQGEMLGFLMQQGLGEATDALLIDESLCIRCDQCERACAATHGNLSRLNREAGPTFAQLHVPTSCRHCEHPHCMKDCPPDAIHRLASGEVYIDDSCIGCGNCEKNCPYDVIQMGVESGDPPSLWSWLLLGRGPEPGTDLPAGNEDTPKKAVKCDMCKDRNAGPACVQACPTGAAIRIGPEELMQLTQES